MASVFLSYSRADAVKAKSIALALEKAGHEVWWDRHIKGGAQYSKEIEAALKTADAVVVLWSEQSVESAWVRDEAAAGRDSGRLVPVLIDGTEPPLGFRQYQSIDMSGWSGRGKPRRLQSILNSIDGVAGGRRERPAMEARTAADLPAMSRNIRLAMGAALIFAVIALAYLLVNRDGRSSAPVVAVTAADNGASTRALADDLFIKLGTLQSVSADALQLVQQDSEVEPDLRFRVAQRPVDGQTHATVALLAGGNDALLWSGEFRNDGRPEADLREQIAYSAALVLKCATEAMTPGHEKLKHLTLKLYLGGCARLSKKNEEPQPLVEIFGKVAQQVPDFEGGWEKLLITETLAFNLARDPMIGRSLQAHMKQARTRPWLKPMLRNRGCWNLGRSPAGWL